MNDRPRIWYRQGYRYQLAGDYVQRIRIRPADPIVTQFIELTSEGVLTVRKGYCWDGPSVPEPFATFGARGMAQLMRGSLVHDACYQLMREALLSERERLAADDELRRMCLEDGMTEDEAESVWRGVRDYGGRSADPHRAQAPVCAPEV